MLLGMLWHGLSSPQGLTIPVYDQRYFFRNYLRYISVQKGNYPFQGVSYGADDDRGSGTWLEYLLVDDPLWKPVQSTNCWKASESANNTAIADDCTIRHRLFFKTDCTQSHKGDLILSRGSLFVGVWLGFNERLRVLCVSHVFACKIRHTLRHFIKYCFSNGSSLWCVPVGTHR